MKEGLFLFISFGLLIIGCKRFDHKESKISEECSCCALADSISGTYTGQLVKYEFSHFDGQANVNVILDTIITVNVTRTYEDLNYLEDSLICQFEVSHLYDSPIRFTSSSIKKGGFYYENRYFEEFMKNGEFNHKRYGSYDNGKWGNYSYPLVDFQGIKDE